MKTCLVSWEIDIDAENPMDAALKALEIQRNSESIATVFRVHVPSDSENDRSPGKWFTVDIYKQTVEED